MQDDANSHNAEVGQTVQAKCTARQKRTMSQTNLENQTPHDNCAECGLTDPLKGGKVTKEVVHRIQCDICDYWTTGIRSLRKKCMQ